MRLRLANEIKQILNYIIFLLKLLLPAEEWPKNTVGGWNSRRSAVVLRAAPHAALWLPYVLHYGLPSAQPRARPCVLLCALPRARPCAMPYGCPARCPAHGLAPHERCPTPVCTSRAATTPHDRAQCPCKRRVRFLCAIPFSLLVSPPCTVAEIFFYFYFVADYNNVQNKKNYKYPNP